MSARPKPSCKQKTKGAKPTPKTAPKPLKRTKKPKTPKTYSQGKARAWINSFRDEPHKHPLMARLAREPAARAAARVLEGALAANGRGPRRHLPPEALPLTLP